ncbi:MAG: heme-degrading domain-containing protein [Alphaproteobacteria bacterium]|uniref:heme-degrading domain-containing protein n=1 Tax=Rhizobium sp. R86522 TaxID=3093861 RepID=UPI0036710E97|nr:heme-degrading domain-containing protein [Alphaproteobacteria bacterium]MBU0833791.1 heme-degrading domain-containing protein [Alphaproteobacteria bacterium]MBU1766033.1 heme-degrading domain-containing protein [Alphaproteobacteria bacterium]
MSLIETIERQESLLVFKSFDERVSLDVGQRIVDLALSQKAPVVIDIRTPDRTLFHAALPGASPDNDHWARRKSNVTLRMHKASLRVGELNRARGRIVSAEIGLDPMDYADHGGSFPVRVEGTGVVAAITVSGLKSEEDHAMIVTVLEAYLGTG